MRKNVMAILLALAVGPGVAADEGKIYMTKFGPVEIVSVVDTTTNERFGEITLAGKTLVSAKGRRNGSGIALLYSVTSFDFLQEGKKEVKIDGQLLKGHLLVSEEIGGCTNKYIILDFTGSKPHVTEPFGLNSGIGCIRFDKAKWGGKTSIIFVPGHGKYVYRTGGNVSSPLDN